MRLYNNQLRIYYKIPEEVDTDLDEAIEKALKPFGFERWASGFALVPKVRDLAFKKGKDEKTDSS